MIKIKRVYDPPSPDDNLRFLVDRMWPRGRKREDLGITDWLRQAAPSGALCKWFGHDPARWEDFRQRYTAELEAQPETWQPLLETARQGDVTLLFAARDRDHNNAAALRNFLEEKLGES